MPISADSRDKLIPFTRTVAITPSKSRGFDFDEVRRVCQFNTIAGLQAMIEARTQGSSHDGDPFRFIYMSGAASERDQTKTPYWMSQYCLMRVSIENASA